MNTNPLHDWAQHLASRGWPVFPLAPGTKHPAIKAWESRASTDPQRIRRCWHAGAGFPCLDGGAFGARCEGEHGPAAGGEVLGPVVQWAGAHRGSPFRCPARAGVSESGRVAR
jgi:hypothetical protein